MTDLLADLDTNGFARVPSVFAPTECRSIVASAEALNALSAGRDFRDRYGMNLSNGGIHFVPGSQRWSGASPYGDAADVTRLPDDDFEETMPEECVPIVADAGDVIVWHGNTVHGSALRRSGTGGRVLYVNGYVRGADSLRGYWAWIRGAPVPLPPIDVPVVVYGAPSFEVFELDRARALLEEYRAAGATAAGPRPS